MLGLDQKTWLEAKINFFEIRYKTDLLLAGPFFYAWFLRAVKSCISMHLKCPFGHAL